MLCMVLMVCAVSRGEVRPNRFWVAFCEMEFCYCVQVEQTYGVGVRHACVAQAGRGDRRSVDAVGGRISCRTVSFIAPD